MHAVRDVIEFGCGDGHQLSLANYPLYIGYDISPDAVTLCRQKFADDSTKSFLLLRDYDGRQADLSLSLDVVFHLTEDSVFDDYMRRLFGAACRFVIVYSSNHDEEVQRTAPHVRHRKFTDWVVREAPGWTLLQKIPNRYPYDGDWKTTSFADFFIFEYNQAIAVPEPLQQ